MHFWILLIATTFAKTTCKEGMVLTDGHCCWPGQFWSSANNECIGEIEACPSGWKLTNDNKNCFNYQEQERKRLEREEEKRVREEAKRIREIEEYKEEERERQRQRREEKRKTEARLLRLQEERKQEERERKEAALEAQREEAVRQAAEQRRIEERNKPKNWYWGACLGSGLSCTILGLGIEYHPSRFFSVGASTMLIANTFSVRVTPFQLKDSGNDYLAMSFVGATNLTLPGSTYYYDYTPFSYGLGFELFTGREILRLEAGVSSPNQFGENRPHVSLGYLQSF